MFLIFFKKKLYIPKISFPILLISCIPFIQYLYNQIFYFENMVLSSLYIFSFWLMLIFGFNLGIDKSLEKNKYSFEKILTIFSYTFIISSILSCVIATLQWLGLAYDSMLMMGLQGNRPYANIAQPNLFATFLIISLVLVIYLFEKNKLNYILATFLSIIFIFNIILTQSRTVWLVFIFLVIFWLVYQKKYSFRLNKKLLILWCLFFIINLIALPHLNWYLANYIHTITQTSTVIERASSGYLRFQIWNQMIHAIWEKPWFGFGWHQTTSAQYDVIDQYYGQEWASSSHNIFLDILIWCGIPLGGLIILYFGYLYLILLKKIKNIESFIAFLIISTVFIHSMVEFPLYYSFFLLPIGLLCGLILVNSSQLKKYYIKPNLIKILFIAGLIFAYYIFDEYNKISDNMVAANMHEMNEFKNEINLPYDLKLFDLFEYRSEWIALYPYTKLDEHKLQDIRYMVKTYLTPYDLYKFSQVLAYNKREEEAKRQLKILEIMYKQKYTYDSILNQDNIQYSLNTSKKD